MAEALIIEFNAPNVQDLYNQVNEELGMDLAHGEAGVNDPATGPLVHLSTLSADGTHMTVTEVWASKEVQATFMTDRLGPALAKVGVPDPTRMEWQQLIGYYPDLDA
jgi:hypothetical protein